MNTDSDDSDLSSDASDGILVFIILYFAATCFSLWTYNNEDEINSSRLQDELREQRAMLARREENPAESIYENV